MLEAGKALKVSIYLSEGAAHHGASTYATILDFLFFRGVAGATVLKGVAGFGAEHHLHSQTTVMLSDQMPLKIEFVETPEKVNTLMGRLQEMVGSGMIEVQDTFIAKPASIESKKVPDSVPEHIAIHGTAKMLRIYIGESDRWHDEPLHESLVRAMRANDLAGVTVYKGILGYGVNRRIHKDKGFLLSHDAPLMLTVVDTEAKIQSFLSVLEEMVDGGLIVMSDAEIIKYSPRSSDIPKE